MCQMAVLGLATIFSGDCTITAAHPTAAGSAHGKPATGQIAAAGDSRGTDPARPQPRRGGGQRQARLRHQLARNTACVTVTVTYRCRLCYVTAGKADGCSTAYS